MNLENVVPQRLVRPLDVEPGHWKKQLATKYRVFARKGDLPGLVALLRQHPEFLNKRGSHGRTLVWEAARSGKLVVVEFLVGEGADVNATGCYNGETLVQISPYCAARYYRRSAVAEYLLAHGATSDIFRAAFLGDRQQVEQELAARPELLVAEDPEDETYYIPLISFAVAGGHAELTGYLIDAGAPIAQYTGQLIDLAARSDRRDLVDLLVRHGADVRAVDSGIFVMVEDLDLLRYFLSKGLSPNRTGRNPQPPLVFVARGDKGERPDRVTLLLDHGAAIDAAGPNGKTALHYAAAAGHVRVMQVLLDRGADPTLLDATGQTALDLARAAGKLAASELLSPRRSDS